MGATSPRCDGTSAVNSLVRFLLPGLAAASAAACSVEPRERPFEPPRAVTCADARLTGYNQKRMLDEQGRERVLLYGYSVVPPSAPGWCGGLRCVSSDLF